MLCYREAHNLANVSEFISGKLRRWMSAIGITSNIHVRRQLADTLHANILNSLRQWCIYASVSYTSLVHIMACGLDGPKPLSEQCWNAVNWTLGNKLQRNLNRIFYTFIQENASKNVVWKMWAILSRLQCVNSRCAVGSTEISSVEGHNFFRAISFQVINVKKWEQFEVSDGPADILAL